MQVMITLLGLMLSGGLFGFIEFMIHRRDDKKEELEKIVKRIDQLETKMTQRLDEIEAKENERDVILARIRILEFVENLREHRNPTRESFVQVLSDITMYDAYCNSHPNFKNDRTNIASKYIKEQYASRLDSEDFI